jgi:hypothetical protein
LLFNNGYHWIRQYLVAPFFPSLGTIQLGRAPFDTAVLDLRTDDVEAILQNAPRS